MEKKLKKKSNLNFFFLDFFFLLIKVSGLVRKTSGFRTAQTLKICRTSGPDLMSGRALLAVNHFNQVVHLTWSLEVHYSLILKMVSM